MITDSGGPGRFRGGLGQEIIVEVISKDPVRVSLLTDRHKHPAQGYMEGIAGAPNRIFVNDGQYIHPKSQTYLNPGDRLTLNYAGGGGFGCADLLGASGRFAERQPGERLVLHYRNGPCG